MLRFCEELVSTPTNAGLQEGSICFGNVRINDNVRCSVGIRGCTFDVQVRTIHLNRRGKSIVWDFFLIFKQPLKHPSYEFKYPDNITFIT